MAEEISLDAQGLQTALAVLQREQTAYLPSASERKRYRAFNLCVYVMAAGVVAEGTMMGGAIGETSEAYYVLLGFVTILVGLLMLATVVLFFLNLGLIRKLHGHAQLRRRLNLRDYFAGAFSAERRATRIANVLTLLLAVLGGCFVVLGLGGLIAVGFADLRAAKIGLMAAASVYVVMVVLGISFFSFHFMRRGQQRLEVVLRLQRTLTDQAAGAGQPKLSPDDYNAIAVLERQHIIRDRATSIASGRKEAEDSTYLCQSSRQMHEAKSRLPPEVLVKVEGAIAQLLSDPATAAASADPVTGSRSIPVAGTGLAIQYDVSAEKNLVRLYDLRASAGAAEAAGGARGIS